MPCVKLVSTQQFLPTLIITVKPGAENKKVRQNIKKIVVKSECSTIADELIKIQFQNEELMQVSNIILQKVLKRTKKEKSEKENENDVA